MARDSTPRQAAPRRPVPHIYMPRHSMARTAALVSQLVPHAAAIRSAHSTPHTAPSTGPSSHPCAPIGRAMRRPVPGRLLDTRRRTLRATRATLERYAALTPRRHDGAPTPGHHTYPPRTDRSQLTRAPIGCGWASVHKLGAPLSGRLRCDIGPTRYSLARSMAGGRRPMVGTVHARARARLLIVSSL